MSLKRNQGIYAKSQSGSTETTITRPDNTTAYVSGDVIGTSPASNLEFTDVLQEVGQNFYITDVKLEIEKSSVPSGMSTFKLHLYDVEPTAIEDNSPYTLLLADGGKYLGYVELDAPEDMGTTLISWTSNINIKRKLTTESKSIYGVLVTDSAWTPGSQDVINIKLEMVGA